MSTDDRPATRATAPGVDRPASILRFKLEFWLVAALMAVAFGTGFAAHDLAQAPQPATTAVPAAIVPAPPLSQEQLEGGLPPGHPSVEGAQVPSSTAKARGSGSGAGGASGSGSKGSGKAPTGSNP